MSNDQQKIEKIVRIEQSVTSSASFRVASISFFARL